ncbi:MAG: thiamine-monophosphate kinase [Herpetosiphonaceae bacterium]|nr:MAG: thiamine-monophosphate kinase [Herpetosiphonaceae bacterium]
MPDRGEFALIERLTAGLPQPAAVVIGVGDDTAALRSSAGRLLLATTDSLVEGVHFRRDWSSAEDVGHKAAAVNLSDIAAMGGLPRWALISLGLPSGSDAGWLERCYAGLTALLGRWGASIVGGNIARSTTFFLDVTLLGEVEPQALARRSAAQPGHVLAVTGTLGAAAAGLALLAAGVTGEDWMQPLFNAQRRPLPRIDEGRALALTGLLGAMCDLSDGIAQDLGHIAASSGVGAVIDADLLPVSDATRRAAALLDKSPLDWALSGGEDYQLLFTCAPHAFDQLRDAVLAAGGAAPSIVGEILPAGAGLRLRRQGREEPVTPSGWDHLRSPE